MSSSLVGIETDLFTAPLDTVLVECPEGVAMHCPSRRDFWFGNVLNLHEPIGPDGLDAALAAWRREYAGIEGVDRQTLKWEGPPSIRAMWPEALPGLEWVCILEHTLKVSAPNDPGGTIRELTLSDWDALVQLHVDSGDDPEGGEAFVRWQIGTMHRERIAAGLTRWWGLWLGGELVGSCGLVCHGGLARFQDICTHPSARRKGVCGTLLHHVASQAPDHRRILAVSEGADAERVYRSLGFTDLGLQGCLARALD